MRKGKRCISEQDRARLRARLILLDDLGEIAEPVGQIYRARIPGPLYLPERLFSDCLSRGKNRRGRNSDPETAKMNGRCLGNTEGRRYYPEALPKKNIILRDDGKKC